jgi:hypothetical protein
LILADGSKVELRPLPIRRLKTFMTELEKLAEVKSEEESLDRLLELSRICLEGIKAEQAGSEDLDDLLDLPSCYKIIEVCGGVKLNDPNLIAAARDMALSGQN